MPVRRVQDPAQHPAPRLSSQGTSQRRDGRVQGERIEDVFQGSISQGSVSVPGNRAQLVRVRIVQEEFVEQGSRGIKI